MLHTIQVKPIAITFQVEPNSENNREEPCACNIQIEAKCYKHSNEA